jgi:hypothetical protein
VIRENRLIPPILLRLERGVLLTAKGLTALLFAGVAIRNSFRGILDSPRLKPRRVFNCQRSNTPWPAGLPGNPAYCWQTPGRLSALFSTQRLYYNMVNREMQGKNDVEKQIPSRDTIWDRKRVASLLGTTTVGAKTGRAAGGNTPSSAQLGALGLGWASAWAIPSRAYPRPWLIGSERAQVSTTRGRPFSVQAHATRRTSSKQGPPPTC